jgi:hypothetical protein
MLLAKSGSSRIFITTSLISVKLSFMTSWTCSCNSGSTSGASSWVSPFGSAAVALPLRRKRGIVGLICSRLASRWCDDDRDDVLGKDCRSTPGAKVYRVRDSQRDNKRQMTPGAPRYCGRNQTFNPPFHDQRVAMLDIYSLFIALLADAACIYVHIQTL